VTADELAIYYRDLLIIQYLTQPRATATIKAFAAEIVADLIAQQVLDAYDLDTAVGAQLTVLAEYRGVNRKYFGLDIARDYFTMPLYGDSTTFGMALYGGIDDVTWYFETYEDTVASVNILTDSEMLGALRFRTKTHGTFLGLGEIDAILYEFFGDKVNLVDNLDMSITYEHTVPDPDTLFKVLDYTGSLPRPAGVSLSVVEV
jgi:hypothetical protein